ncbi:MAG TPA: hypothetical protein VJS64_17300 [Pyrinomonadaceae bacterium]|nr:hypothetical protein [Pyrinomonadaceae bacterium]
MKESTSTDLTPDQKTRQEGQKLLYDAFKHLTTLSTGSILILATFLEKFFREPEWTPLIAVAFLGFIAATVSSFITMLALSNSVFKLSENTETGSRLGAAGFIFSLVTFVIGISSLVAFALKNFY